MPEIQFVKDDYDDNFDEDLAILRGAVNVTATVDVA